MAASNLPAADNAPAEKRRRTRTAVLLLAFLVVAGAVVAYLAWRNRPPDPPAVDLSGTDPAVAQAVEEARAAVERSPRSGPAWGRLGMVLLAHGFPVPAGICFAQAERYEPGEPRWPYLHGHARLQANDPAGAVPCWERALAAGADDAAVRLRLGEALLEEGRLDEAERLFRRALDMEPADPRVHLDLGRLALQRGDARQALGHLSRAAQGAPGRRTPHALLAEAYGRLKDRPAAERQQRLLEGRGEDPPWPDPYLEEVEQLQAGVEGAVEQAEKLLGQKKPREALEVLQEAVRRHPRSPEALGALGRTLIVVGAFQEAEPVLREACDLRPDSFRTRCDLGFVLKRLGKVKPAAECYRKAAELKPGDGMAHYQLAHCYHLLGDRKEAIRSLRAAVRFKPDFAEAHRELGDLLAQAGRYAEAEGQLRDAVRLAPGDKGAARLLQSVREKAGGKGKTRR